MTFKPAELDLTIVKGDSFFLAFALKNTAGDAISIAGKTVLAEVRSINSGGLLYTLTPTITDAAGGLWNLSQTTAESAIRVDGNWSLTIFDTVAPTTDTVTYLRGRVTVEDAWEGRGKPLGSATAPPIVITVGGQDPVTLEVSGTSDPTAIHDNIANEISAITAKATPVGDDVLVLEDSEASFVKKKATVSSLMSGSIGGADPEDVTKAAAAEGSSSSAARLDHKHDITTAAAVSVGAANAEGDATTLARSNHTHQVVDLKIASQAQGDLLHFNGANWVRLAIGDDGQVLKSNGTDVVWQDDIVQITLGTDEDPLTEEDDKTPIDFVLGFPITITELLLKVKTAPTDADIQVSLQGSGAGDETFVDIVIAANGVISAGSKFGSTADIESGTAARAKNSILRLNQDQIGSTIAGSIITATVIGKKT